jgi:hypothetical protein
MTRQEHLKWCKQRANHYFDRGDVSQGISSFLSDITKSEYTKDIAEHPLCVYGALISDIDEARKFVNGWK